jgi:hypothetical protein
MVIASNLDGYWALLRLILPLLLPGCDGLGTPMGCVFLVFDVSGAL